MKRASSRSRSLTLRLSACSDGTRYRTEYRAVLFSYGQLVPDRPIAPQRPVREGNVCGSGTGPRPFPRSDAKVQMYIVQNTRNQRAPFSSLSVKCLHEQNCGGPWWRGTCITLADRHWPARPADHLEALSARHVAHFLRTAPCSLERESTAARQDLLLLGALFLCPGPPSPSMGFPLHLLPGLRPHLQLLALANNHRCDRAHSQSLDRFLTPTLITNRDSLLCSPFASHTAPNRIRNQRAHSWSCRKPHPHPGASAHHSASQPASETLPRHISLPARALRPYPIILCPYHTTDNQVTK